MTNQDRIEYAVANINARLEVIEAYFANPGRDVERFGECVALRHALKEVRAILVPSARNEDTLTLVHGKDNWRT